MILALNTSGKLTGIYLIEENKELVAMSWEAGYALSEQLLPEIVKLLKSFKADWKDLNGVVIFEGPGSFTGLRIGFTTANTIAYSLNIPIASAGNEDWMAKATAKLKSKQPGKFEFPEYGAPAQITLPKAK